MRAVYEPSDASFRFLFGSFFDDENSALKFLLARSSMFTLSGKALTSLKSSRTHKCAARERRPRQAMTQFWGTIQYKAASQPANRPTPRLHPPRAMQPCSTQ